MSIPPAPGAKRPGGADPRRRPDASEPLGFAPTPEESAFFAEMFRRADVDGSGAIAPSVVLQLLPKSGLGQDSLRAIWAVADSDNKGFLTMAGFYRALKLVAVAQAGQPVTAGLLSMKTPLPAFEGIPSDIGMAPPPPTPVLSRAGTGFSLGLGEQSAYNVSPEERTRWMNAFQQAGPVNGVVGAVAARDFFLRSGLPPETLSKIWTLADGQGRGALNLSHFLVAMFLVSRVKSGALPAVPASLPPHVISGITTGQQTSAASTPFDMPMSPSKMPASTPFTPQQPVVSAPAAAPILAAQSTETLNWAIGPKEKDAYDRVFEKSDVGGKGYLSSEEASNFFRQSNLPSNSLASIWTLSNVSKTGRYSREEFAVAMHLIRQARAGIPLPTTLPANLVPPSMRNPAPSAIQPPAPPPEVDLFSFEALPPIPTPAAVSSAPSGIFSPALTASPLPGTPAMPRQMIGTAPIPTPPAVATPSFETPIARSPLIGMDSSREESLRNDIASRKQEVSMAQLQASTVAITADQAKQRVADLEAELARLAQEKAEVTGRVSQVRALYEADRMVVQQLESQAGPLREEVVGLRAELDRTALERDALRNQIDSMNRDIMQLRMERESLVLQTRDAGKMLRSDGEAVAELEREVHFLKDEVEKLQHEVAEAAKERERTAADHEMKLADRERLRAQAAHLRAENEKIMKEAADIAAQTAALTVLSDEAPAEAAVEEVSASEIQAAAGTIPSPKPILAEEALPATVAPSALTVDISALEDPFAEPPEPSPPIPDASTKPERGSSWKARTPEPPAKTPEPVVESIAVEEAEPTPAPVALTVDAMPALPVSPVDEIVEPAPRTPSPFDVDHFENRFPDVDTEFVIAEAPASSSDVAALASQPEEPGKSGVAEALPVSPVSAATPETRPSASVNVDHEGAISPTSAPVETAAEQSSAEQVSETLFEAKPQAPNESNPFELEAASTSAASAPATASVAVTKTPFDMPDLDAEFEDAFKDIPAAGTAGAAAAFDDSVFDATFDDDFKFESQANFGTPAPASGQSVPAMSAVVSPPPVPAPAPSQVPAPTFPPENSEVTPISGISGNFVSFENTFDAPFDDFGREAKPPVAAASEEDPFVALAKGGPIPELSKATAADIDSAFGPGGNVPAAGDSGNPFAGAPVAVTAPPDFDAAFEADFDSAFQGGAGAATFEAADGKAAPEAAAPAAVEKEPVAAAGDEAEEVRLVKEMTSCTTEVAMDALYKTDWNVERAINQILG